ncbi:MAG: phosphotriesterase [Chloroflexota bacterium]
MTSEPQAQSSERTDRSGVMTVSGLIASDELGITLMHEHVFNDVSSWWRGHASGATARVSRGPIDVSIIGELRMDPFSSKDNCVMSDFGAAAEELAQFRDLGGRTVVETTGIGIGRDPRALRRVSEATGLQIVMGSGFYLEESQPARTQDMSVDDIADEIVRDASDGVDGSGVRAGIIGEIGVGVDFSPAERKSLRGAARAQRATGLPLSVHLPGWRRYAHEVLDVVAEEGGDVQHTVLCHMNPSGEDFDYQASVAERGAYIEYDMVGMDYYYADQGAQCPSDEENARNIARLVENGYGDHVLLSQDVFLKMMLTRYGGFGFAYILRHFVPRLVRHGLQDAQIDQLLVANPRAVFA